MNLRAFKILSPTGTHLALFNLGEFDKPIAILEKRIIEDIFDEWFHRILQGEPDVKYPEWFGIIEQCKEIMKHNAIQKRKGNSWLEMNPHDKFWNQKLDEEVKEVKLSEDVNTEIKELHDVINICSMRIDLLKKAQRSK